MRWWRFLFWNAAGGIVWAISVGLLVYWGGKALADAIQRDGLYVEAGPAFALAGGSLSTSPAADSSNALIPDRHHLERPRPGSRRARTSPWARAPSSASTTGSTPPWCERGAGRRSLPPTRLAPGAEPCPRVPRGASGASGANCAISSTVGSSSTATTFYGWIAQRELPAVANGDFHRPEHLPGWKTLLLCAKDATAVVDYVCSARSTFLTRVEGRAEKTLAAQPRS